VPGGRNEVRGAAEGASIQVLLDACLRLKLLDAAQHEAGKQMVVRIVAMLIRLAQACEEPRTGSVRCVARAWRTPARRPLHRLRSIFS